MLVLQRMAEALDELHKLFARANAAIAEAQQLVESNRQWQEDLEARAYGMYFRATFRPKTLKFFRLIEDRNRAPPPKTEGP